MSSKRSDLLRFFPRRKTTLNVQSVKQEQEEQVDTEVL